MLFIPMIYFMHNLKLINPPATSQEVIAHNVIDRLQYNNKSCGNFHLEKNVKRTSGFADCLLGVFGTANIIHFQYKLHTHTHTHPPTHSPLCFSVISVHVFIEY